MNDTIRWGIMGTGVIARKFADGLAVLPDATLVSVGSRSRESADAFGALYGVERRHDSYEGLAHDPGVDVIYIATPHTLHRENAILCLEAGKAVLCEKPFTINAAEAREVVALARTRGLFLMEAMWTRFIPVFAHIRALLSEGALGEVRMLTADFGFRAPFDAEQRLFNPALGGGALLDVGVYPVSLASLVFGGPPARIMSQAHLGETGVDEESAMLFGYDRGQMALLSCAVRTETPQTAVIAGTEGLIRIPPRWWCARTFTLEIPGAPEQTFAPTAEGNLYNYEAAEVMRCLREGLTESAIMPLDETIAIMETLDAVRAPWGLVYPSERRAGA
jgi:dihydrodiol dehydrogenase / D-xylose 1-dehydrogenase (NADP)